MLIVFIARLLGRLCAVMPESFVEKICHLIGDGLFFLPNKRRYQTLSNLNHAFPEKGMAWQRKIARESLRRLIETLFFVFASPYFNEKRLRKIISIPSETQTVYNKYSAQSEKGGVALIPHFTLFEAFTALPLFYPRLSGFGAIFRPFDNAHLNRWVKQTRERWGIRLFSRKAGLSEAMTIVRNGGWIGVLFDLNAGGRGALFPFMGRIAATTPLPGMICSHYNATPLIAYIKRKSFWQGELRLEYLNTSGDAQAITLAANRWLERYLCYSDDNCADWMWGQQRWKAQARPGQRLNLNSKKDYIRTYLQSTHQAKLLQSTRLWIRMPNWLGDCVMALPLIRVLRKARPDAEITLIASSAFIPFLKAIAIADKFIPLPDRKKGYYTYFKFFYRLKERYPDTVFLFTHSLRGDLEAFLTGTPQRFGVLRQKKKRPLLSDYWSLPQTLNEAETHQTKLWEKYLRYFGLREDPDYSPLPWKTVLPQSSVIGLICGTENNPEKRWPVDSWRALIQSFLEKFPETLIHLFGVAGDHPVTQKVADNFPTERVINLAGKTTLCGFADSLKQCRFVICNDTGGMHLANALGIPVMVLFGPTNPLRTGPIFQAPVVIIQPEGAPKTGGSAIEKIQPETVLAYVENTGWRTRL